MDKAIVREQAAKLCANSVRLIEQILIKSNQGVIAGAWEAVQNERIETLREVFDALDEMHIKCSEPTAIHKGCRLALGSAMDMVKEKLAAAEAQKEEK